MPLPARDGPPPGAGWPVSAAPAGVVAERRPALLLVLPAPGPPQRDPVGAGPGRLCLNPTPRFHPLDGVALGIWSIAVVGESVADAQLDRFRKDPGNKVAPAGLASAARPATRTISSIQGCPHRSRRHRQAFPASHFRPVCFHAPTRHDP